MDEHLSIGRFSALSGLSPKALRIYHDQQLLVPAQVDPDTGYRSYDPDQVSIAARISLLRRAGVSLADIAAFLRAPDVDQIDAWHRALDAEVAAKHRLLDHLARLSTTVPPKEVTTVTDPSTAPDPAARATDGGPTLERAIPVLASVDLEATQRFYAERLGFQALVTYPDHAIAGRDGIQVHFWLTDDAEIPKQTGCRIDVTGIDALHEEMQATGVVHPNGPLRDQPWGLREFSVLDGDGNLITFAERIAA